MNELINYPFQSGNIPIPAILIIPDELFINKPLDGTLYKFGIIR